MENSVAYALQHRPDMKVASLSKQQAACSIDVANAGNKLQVSLAATNYFDDKKAFGKDVSNKWTVGIYHTLHSVCLIYRSNQLQKRHIPDHYLYAFLPLIV